MKPGHCNDCVETRDSPIRFKCYLVHPRDGAPRLRDHWVDLL